MQVYIVELSTNHHNVWETYARALGSLPVSVYGVISAHGWQLVEKSVSPYVKGVFVWGRRQDRCFRCSNDKLGFLLRKVREKYALRSILPLLLGGNTRKIFVFTTLDAHINPHFDVLFKLIDEARRKGNVIVGTIHNTDMYGAKGYEYFPREFYSWHNRVRWYMYRRWIGGGWSQKIDMLITCGNIAYPQDMKGKRVIIYSRIFETTWHWAETETFNVAVTGSMDARRINWELLLQVLELLRVEKSLRFIFLGEMEESLSMHLKEMMGERAITFTYYVDEVTFRKYLSQTHLIVAPLRDRRYGNYTVSGSVEADAVMFGIPVVVPSFYESAPEGLLWKRYGNALEMYEAILGIFRLWQEGRYEEYRRDVMKAMRYASLDGVKRQWAEIIDRLGRV